jgi:hypothetical protein
VLALLFNQPFPPTFDPDVDFVARAIRIRAGTTASLTIEAAAGVSAFQVGAGSRYSVEQER